MHARLGGSGGMTPRKLDALRLLLRPFWDRSRAVVATCLAEYCIQFLAVHIAYTLLLSQLTSNRISTKEGTTVGETAGGVTDVEIVCREYVREARCL